MFRRRWTYQQVIGMLGLANKGSLQVCRASPQNVQEWSPDKTTLLKPSCLAIVPEICRNPHATRCRWTGQRYRVCSGWGSRRDRPTGYPKILGIQISISVFVAMRLSGPLNPEYNASNAFGGRLYVASNVRSTGVTPFRTTLIVLSF